MCQSSVCTDCSLIIVRLDAASSSAKAQCSQPAAQRHYQQDELCQDGRPPKPPDNLIPLQIRDESNLGHSSNANNRLRPKHHDVDLDQIDDTARFLQQLGPSPVDKWRVQLSSAYCDAKKLPKESLSLAAIRRSSRVPPALNLERFKRTSGSDRDAPSTMSDAGSEHLTLKVFAVKLLAHGYQQRVDQGDAFPLAAFRRQHAMDAWRPPVEPRFCMVDGLARICIDGVDITFHHEGDFPLASDEIVSMLWSKKQQCGRD